MSAAIRPTIDGWAQMGCRGWSYDDVLPYFRKSETTTAAIRTYRGRERPAAGRGLPHHPAADPPLRRGGAAGRLRADRPQRRQAGRRRLFADDPPRPVPRLDRAHLSCARRASGRTCTVETNAMAARLLFEGKRCVGVGFRAERQDGRGARRRGRCIVSGGAVNSPQLLQVSGIGPAAHLRIDRRRGAARPARRRRQPARTITSPRSRTG